MTPSIACSDGQPVPAGVLAAPQEAAVDSPANYLASYCTATSGPCVNHEQPVGSAAPQVRCMCWSG
jgi:hypothetical protein